MNSEEKIITLSKYESIRCGAFSYLYPLSSLGILTNFSAATSEAEQRRDLISFILNYNPFEFVKDSEEYEQVLRPTLKKISFHVYIFQSAALLGCYYLFFFPPQCFINKQSYFFLKKGKYIFIPVKKIISKCQRWKMEIFARYK